nr:RNA-directed DNA polymerase, eukaryota [Tanacetum cinerariifolium]
MNCLSLNIQGLGSKAKKDWIRELNIKHKVYFLSLQETKADNITNMDVKILWGNSNFEFIHSEALGNSGGILCVWDNNVLRKEHHTISDNFIAVSGTWIPIKMKVMIISVYAPQVDSYKRVLWSYLELLVNHWNGESIIMGDFNEVRRKEEHWGCTFNAYGARLFNSFISNAGLVDLQLEGFSFTWSNPSASKMSKLDRFLVTDGLISLFPHISAVCLDRHLSNHRPILIREVITDYGATPFPRTDYMNLLLEAKSADARDYIQKAKIQWAVEGDENSKIFHGIVNRKRANLTVKGIMVDGVWVDEPNRVKKEFRDHFAARFQDPGICQGKLNFSFPNRLSSEQVAEFEIPISKEEIRNADYLEDVLHSFGFGVKWRSWIKGCLSSSMASILVNGSPTLKFQFHRGLKQGDPLALYLFILIMESLHLSFSRVIDARIFNGVKIDASTMISHLFYANDAVFIGDWSQSNIKGIMHTLHCFSLLSGLSIKIRKSSLLGVGVPSSQVFKAANLLGCSVMKMPFKYLGINVGGNNSLIKAWDESINKLKTRLSKWKLKTLSIGGRLTLLKSRFYGSKDDDRKIAWVKWAKVLALMKYEGLGVSCFYALNRALLLKWVWRFISHENSLWSRFIHACHGSNGKDLLVTFPSNWCSIVKEFPRLYALEVDKDCYVDTKLKVPIASSFRHDKWVWDMNGDGDFRVKDARNVIDETFLPKSDTPTRWVRSIPIKINIFAWKVSLDRLPTRVNLVRRGVLVSPISCQIGCSDQEDLNHILFRCDMAVGVTRLVCRWWNQAWIPFDSYHSWYIWFKEIRLPANSKGVLEGVFYVMWWSIWFFRNQLLFAAKNPRKDILFDDIVLRSFNWCSARSKCNFRWDSWVQHPHLISL